ncbi:MAG: DUF255 domain-containing protein [Bacteroidota bacterium]
MKHIIRIGTLAIGLMLLMGFKPVEQPTAHLNWITIEEAIELSAKSDKKILIDLYTDWCGWCKVMERDTYSKQEVVDYINEHYYPVKFNAEQKGEVVVKDHTYKFVANGRRGYHELAAALTQGKLSYPTTVFLDENLNLLTSVSGYQKAPQMLPILAYFGEDAYKNQGWEDFSNEYKTRSGK